MANDIYTMTPGSAVADTLREIMIQRKLEARQAMLDKLNEESTRHGMGIQDRQAAVQEAGEKRAGRVADENITTSKIARVPNKPNLGAIKAGDEDLYNAIYNSGMINQTPTVTPMTGGRMIGAVAEPDSIPAPGDSSVERTSVVGTPPTVDTFSGDKDFQKNELQRSRLLGLGGDEAFKKGSGLEQHLAIQAAGGQAPAAGLLGPPGVQRIFSAGGRKMSEFPVNPNDPKAEVLSHPPTQGSSFQYAGTDPTTGNPMVMLPSSGQFQVRTPIGTDGKPVTGGIGPKPSAAQPRLIVPPGAWAELRRAYSATNNRLQAVEQAKSGIKAQAIERGVTPQAMFVFDKIMNDVALFDAAGKPRPTMEAIMGSIKNATEKDQQDIMSLVYGLLGNGEN